jgi:polyisoprenyl-teichoic acid--peptidoglycan teichoic acid transferase
MTSTTTSRRRSRHRRARGLAGTLGLTLASTVLPGSGMLYAGRRVLGLLLLVPALALFGYLAWYVVRAPQAALDVAFDPGRLTVVTTVALAVLLVWVLNVVLTYVMVRPGERRRGETLLGGAFVLLMCVAVAAPLGVVARYSMVQKHVVQHVFQHNKSATAPVDVTEEDPWGGRDRVTVLLLGGDGNVHRPGVRTDSVVLASIDVHTGRTVLFSLPRNLMRVPFPRRSPLHALYPDGFTGPGDPAEWLLNAVYRNVPALHPGVLGRSDNEGADAVKQAVAGALGLHVDYYLLVNLAGFRSIVQAIGGVTVNINQPIPIGGVTDLGIPPDAYLQPGPHQRLNGFQALWFARGRYGSDDYQRMERQRCMIDAIINEAQPLTLLRRYEKLAAVGQEIVRTDIPSDLLSAFVDLATEVKGSQVRSVVFRASAQFAPSNPDYAWMHQKVRTALRTGSSGPTPTPTPSATATPSPSATPTTDPADATDAADACGYHPVS